tara:strand:- start:5038 stop:5232 length:195 start_codon:yes stop_codon:yes gene_type:complete
MGDVVTKGAECNSKHFFWAFVIVLFLAFCMEATGYNDECHDLPGRDPSIYEKCVAEKEQQKLQD